jgi:hypothetical protein
LRAPPASGDRVLTSLRTGIVARRVAPLVGEGGDLAEAIERHRGGDGIVFPMESHVVVAAPA